jgi:hypothetical protein
MSKPAQPDQSPQHATLPGRGHHTPEVGYRIQSWSIRGALLASSVKWPARRERRSAEPVFASAPMRLG